MAACGTPVSSRTAWTRRYQDRCDQGIALPTPESGPHGLTVDEDGNIWFTANSKGYIGKLDPETSQVTEYKLPEAARDPHTPLFDQKGMLWFTVQGANMVGRLDPKTKEVKMATRRRRERCPTVWSSALAACRSSSNSASTRLAASIRRRWRSPNIHCPMPRRVHAAWRSPATTCCGTRTTRADISGGFDPKTGKATEWPSPSGPKSQPYGITAYKDIIWYSESAVRPNTLVRFDPKTEKFQTWTIPSGGGVVRNMMPTKEGSLVIAESGVNKVALIEVQ